MPAREQLNAAYFHGSLALAAILAMAYQSWAVFGCSFLALIVGNLVAGEVRLKSRNP